jgi:hypothetical protein
VFYDRYKIKSNKGLRIKITVIIQVKKKKKKEEKTKTAALGGVERLNKAQII